MRRSEATETDVAAAHTNLARACWCQQACACAYLNDPPHLEGIMEGVVEENADLDWKRVCWDPQTLASAVARDGVAAAAVVQVGSLPVHRPTGTVRPSPIAPRCPHVPTHGNGCTLTMYLPCRQRGQRGQRGRVQVLDDESESADEAKDPHPYVRVFDVDSTFIDL